ncbi:hypothetical protein LZD49_32740 [Dyadobacter sp. CY261]|uniref:hypothetical protein n=1 Tax=Dyadobacter sp. CY261 TaxID=2907203 RepID=UPI001F2CB5AB|nr:hypothetical protein [Dyadobacter sp. CY261]MCF0075292.1 hypothetical protein [Dyadobacter sp. CY261]
MVNYELIVTGKKQVRPKLKKYYHLIRIGLGVVLALAVTMSLIKGHENIDPSTRSGQVLKSLWDTAYLMHTVKAVEILCAISLLLDRYVKLTSIMLMTIVFNIIMFDVFADNLKGLASASVILLLLVSLMLININSYKSILSER